MLWLVDVHMLDLGISSGPGSVSGCTYPKLGVEGAGKFVMEMKHLWRQALLLSSVLQPPAAQPTEDDDTCAAMPAACKSDLDGAAKRRHEMSAAEKRAETCSQAEAAFKDLGVPSYSSSCSHILACLRGICV